MKEFDTMPPIKITGPLCLFLYLLAVAIPVFSQPDPPPDKSLWLAIDDFRALPQYLPNRVLKHLPDSVSCDPPECQQVKVDGDTYLYAQLITQENSATLLPGKWTGGACENDYWIIEENGHFRSAFPDEGSVYAWQGTYTLQDGLYEEIGINHKGEKEHNAAYLYYVPILDVVVFKGIKSMDATGEYYYYGEVPEYPYFQRCGKSR